MGIYLLKVDNKNVRCKIKDYDEATTSVCVFVNFGRISHFFGVSIVDFEQANAGWGIKKMQSGSAVLENLEQSSHLVLVIPLLNLNR